VYRYRLVFPRSPDAPIEQTETAMIESEKPYAVGDRIEYEGKTWQVTQAPREAQHLGDFADLGVWPADAEA
jgi:hypothetical protein